MTHQRSQRRLTSRRQSPDRPPLFAVDPDVGDRRRLVHRLDHVDERERGDRDAGERLHLDAGAVGRPDRRGDVDAVVARPSGRPSTPCDRDRVAQRHEVRRPLRGLDPGHAGPPPARRPSARPSPRSSVDHLGASTSTRPAAVAVRDGDRLGGHVDHPRAARLVEVGEPRRRAGSSVTVTPPLQHHHGRPSPPPGDLGDVLRHDRQARWRRARSATRCEPCPPTGVTTYAAVARRRASRAANCRRPAGERQPLRAATPAPAAGPAARRRASAAAPAARTPRTTRTRSPGCPAA